MNRRALFGMIIGSLVAGHLVENVSLPFPSGRPRTGWSGHYEVLGDSATPVAELFVSVGQDVSRAVSGLTSLGNHLDATAERLRDIAPAGMLFAVSGRTMSAEGVCSSPNCVGGPLFIGNENEAQSFLRLMAEAIKQPTIPKEG